MYIGEGVVTIFKSHPVLLLDSWAVTKDCTRHGVAV